MREIKFRAWEVDRKNMFDVNPVWFEENNWIHTDFALCMNDEGCVIMQYTGLKDKNGVEIYEGDILDKKWRWLVEMIDGCWSVRIPPEVKTLWEISKHRLKAGVPIEVIGNIYENPELLEDKT